MPRVILTFLVAFAAAALPIGAAAGQLPQTSGPPLTLQDALAQARLNSQQFRSAQLAADLATEDRKQARAALLPSLNGFSQFIYTEPNGTTSGIWVPNDGPKGYADWLNVHRDVSLTKWSEYRASSAAEAVARAKADVAARGLVSPIVTTSYTPVVPAR